MTGYWYRFPLLALVLIVSVMGCSGSDTGESPDAPGSESVDELPDVQTTEQLQQSLMQSLSHIADKQDNEIDQSNVDDLQALSESDRQVLIDETLDQSESESEQDLEKLAESFEETKGIEHAPLETPGDQ